jgi:hypothetical protein
MGRVVNDEWKTDQVKGQVKEAAGALTGDKDLERRIIEATGLSDVLHIST